MKVKSLTILNYKNGVENISALNVDVKVLDGIIFEEK